jgi:hypothetical protein
MARRLKRTGRKQTFSISVSPTTRARLRAAAREYGGNVSALIEALVIELDRRDALEWLLHRAAPVDSAAYAGFLAELSGTKRRRAA